MFKDKQKDMIRAILPSTARLYARHKGRYISRARRRAFKEALHNLDPEDWDDSEMYRHVGPRLSRLRSEECERIRERRGADKLGPLKRWTEHHKRTSESDEEAYEKICQVLKPEQNLITQHAVGHAEWWLELEKDQYRYNYYYTPRVPLIPSERVEEIIRYLFENDHAKLNKILKSRERLGAECKEEDPCTIPHHEEYDVHEVWYPKLKYWQSYSEGDVGTYWFRNRYGESPLLRTRHVVRDWLEHIHQKCRNRKIIRTHHDVDRIARSFGSVYRKSRYNRPRPTLRRILELAYKHDLVSANILQEADI